MPLLPKQHPIHRQDYYYYFTSQSGHYRQDSREVLKSLIELNDKMTIENIKINGKAGILVKEKGTWASGEPATTYFIYYWLDPKTIVSAYFIESPTDKWEDMKKSMMSIDVSRYLPS